MSAVSKDDSKSRKYADGEWTHQESGVAASRTTIVLAKWTQFHEEGYPSRTGQRFGELTPDYDEDIQECLRA